MVLPLLFSKRSRGGEVIPPQEFSWKPPMKIFRGNVGEFRTNLDLKSYANIQPQVTYYVKTDGNNGNSGLTWELAKASISGAITTANAGGVPARIKVAAGYYPRNGAWLTAPTVNIEVIADLSVGSGGKVYSTTDYKPTLTSWTLDTNHYEHTGATVTVASVLDESNLNGYGLATPLVQVASEALCDSTANSWYYDGTADVLYIHTTDSREPDDDIIILTSQAGLTHNTNGITVYVEGITFWSYAHTTQNTSAAGGVKFYAKDCEFMYAFGTNINLLGVDEAIVERCLFAGSQTADGIGSAIRNTIVGRRIEIDCISYGNGTGVANQASTSHDGAKVIRVNGQYYNQPGQCIADVGSGAEIWCLGTYCYGSATLDDFFIQDVGSVMWLDTCRGGVGGNYNITASLSAIAYYRKFSPVGFTTNGTVLQY